jgi:hypothetical protein
LAIVKWLQDHMLRCPFKYITGVDCPGCGFQRSVLDLLQGDLHKSIQLYPPAIPLLVFFAYGIADGLFKLDTKNEWIKKTGFIVTGAIVMVSYCLKLYAMYKGQAISL